MSRYQNLEDRFDLLVDKLGLTEYKSLKSIVFYRGDDGILQTINESKDATIKTLSDRLDNTNANLALLLDYLNLEVVDAKKQIIKKKGAKK